MRERARGRACVCACTFLTGGEKMNIPGEIIYFRGFHVVRGFSLVSGVLFASLKWPVGGIFSVGGYTLPLIDIKDRLRANFRPKKSP
jgi:hypothetical protein